MRAAEPNPHQQEILERAIEVLDAMGPPCDDCGEYHQVPAGSSELLLDAIAIREEFNITMLGGQPRG
jgi:hypothetical protein